MAQRLGHPKPGLPDDLQQEDDQQHLREQRKRRGLFRRLDFIEQLRRDKLGQVDCETDEDPRQEDAEVERTIFQDAQEGRKERRSRVVVEAVEIFAEEGGQHQRRGTAVD